MDRAVEVAEKEFVFNVEEGSRPPLLLLGVRKSGSSIFFQIAKAMARRAKLNVVDFPETFFKANVRENVWRRVPEVADLFQPGNVYLGFRAAPLCLQASPHLRGATMAMLVRDPRDALVSEYFSNAFSHRLPEGDDAEGARKVLMEKRQAALNSDVEEYVMRMARPLRNTYQEYVGFLKGLDLQIIRYEDYIFDKRKLMAFIAGLMQVEFEPAFIDQILGWADVRPQTEDPHRFVRKVTPGDHREKLSPACISELNALFAPVVKQFGYDL